jgi:hypothetical protein
MANLEQTGLDKVISLTASMLKLHSFYTVGPKEASASLLTPLVVSLQIEVSC